MLITTRDNLGQIINRFYFNKIEGNASKVVVWKLPTTKTPCVYVTCNTYGGVPLLSQFLSKCMSIRFLTQHNAPSKTGAMIWMMAGECFLNGNKTREGVSMVHFNKNENQPCGTFTFSVEGDNEDYVNTLISLLNLISAQHENHLNCKDINNVNQLIISMLPDPDQIINKTDITLTKLGA